MLSHNQSLVNRKSTRSTDTRESELDETRSLLKACVVSSSSSQQHKRVMRAQNPQDHKNLLTFSKEQLNLTHQTAQNPTMEGRPPHMPNVQSGIHKIPGKLTNPFPATAQNPNSNGSLWSMKNRWWAHFCGPKSDPQGGPH